MTTGGSNQRHQIKNFLGDKTPTTLNFTVAKPLLFRLMLAQARRALVAVELIGGPHQNLGSFTRRRRAALSRRQVRTLFPMKSDT